MGKKVLVVDDDESILDAVALILEEYDYTVDTVFKGQETFKKIDKFQPDVILLDVLMSGNDGRTICRTLKSNPQTKNIPVIMISAHPNAGEGASNCGANDFLAKPFDTEDLITLVRKHTS